MNARESSVAFVEASIVVHERLRAQVMQWRQDPCTLPQACALVMATEQLEASLSSMRKALAKERRERVQRVSGGAS
jgi:hypothetical protein